MMTPAHECAFPEVVTDESDTPILYPCRVCGVPASEAIAQLALLFTAKVDIARRGDTVILTLSREPGDGDVEAIRDTMQSVLAPGVGFAVMSPKIAVSIASGG